MTERRVSVILPPIVVGVLVWGLVHVTSSCLKPQLPPVAGCTERAWRCHGARPELCSGGRWFPQGDMDCEHGCGFSDAGRAHCVHAQDGGAE